MNPTSTKPDDIEAFDSSDDECFQLSATPPQQKFEPWKFVPKPKPPVTSVKCLPQRQMDMENPSSSSANSRRRPADITGGGDDQVRERKREKLEYNLGVTSISRQVNRTQINPRQGFNTDDDVSEFLGDVGTMINKRLQAKRWRIKSNFKMVQAPATLFAMQEKQSAVRKEKLHKYESLVGKFQAEVDSVVSRQEKNMALFEKMMGSILKTTKSLTLDIEKIKDGVESCVDLMKDGLQTLETDLKKSGETAAENLADELEAWENECLSTEESQAVAQIQCFLKFI